MKRQNEIARNGHINVDTGRDNRKIERNVSLPDLEPKVLLARRLARSHGGQGTNCLTVSLKEASAERGFAFQALLLIRMRTYPGTDLLSDRLRCRSDDRQPALHHPPAHNQTTVNNAFEVNTVSDFLCRRQYLAGEFHLANSQRAAFAFATEPAQIEAYQLPHGIQPQTAA